MNQRRPPPLLLVELDRHLGACTRIEDSMPQDRLDERTDETGPLNPLPTRIQYFVCSGSVDCVVVTVYDFESCRPGSNHEWGLIYYKASITAQGLPESSSLRGSKLGTRAAEHRGCNWGMQVD